MRRNVGIALIAVGALIAVAPATAGAETRSFYDTTPLFPVGPASASGPANDYPSTIPVSGVPGTVTGVEVTMFAFSSANADDTDAVIVGPNGAQVMLFSDACGDNGASDITWTFDDAAPTFVSNNGPCTADREESVRPSNYLGNDGTNDDLSVPPGGPAPPYVNSLASLAGGTPNGDWKLFVFDDNDFGFSGFEVNGWALRLEVAPPPAPPSNPTPSAAPAASTPSPVNTAKPQLSGKAKSGKTLTCGAGSWIGSPSFAYAWLRNGESIAGETKTTLKVARRDAGKAIQCEVRATGAGETAVEQSKPVVPKKAKRKSGPRR